MGVPGGAGGAQVVGPWVCRAQGSTALVQVVVDAGRADVVVTEMRQWPGGDPVGSLAGFAAQVAPVLRGLGVQGAGRVRWLVRQGPYSTYDPTDESVSEVLLGVDALGAWRWSGDLREVRSWGPAEVDGLVRVLGDPDVLFPLAQPLPRG